MSSIPSPLTSSPEATLRPIQRIATCSARRKPLLPSREATDSGAACSARLPYST
jgi:hypothetical protein